MDVAPYCRSDVTTFTFSRWPDCLRSPGGRQAIRERPWVGTGLSKLSSRHFLDSTIVRLYSSVYRNSKSPVSHCPEAACAAGPFPRRCKRARRVSRNSSGSSGPSILATSAYRSPRSRACTDENEKRMCATIRIPRGNFRVGSAAVGVAPQREVAGWSEDRVEREGRPEIPLEAFENVKSAPGMARGRETGSPSRRRASARGPRVERRRCRARGSPGNSAGSL